ncbi:MAG: MFS transporter [Dehalococcoidia bacterium]|jgi:MFS family permease|nr:MFS transporter [Dehalococcoidia bacterium]
MVTNRSTRGRRQPHYAWVVLASALAIGAVSAGVRQSFGVLIDPLVEQYGWNRGDISAANSTMFLSSVALLLAAGALADRVGIRKIALVAAGVTIAGMFLTGTMSSLWQFYLFYGVLLGGFSMVFVVALPVLITRWFHTKVGISLGLMWASLAVGAMIASPILRWLIINIGWRGAFFTTGIAGGAILLIAVYFIRDHPRDMGTLAYGAELPSHTSGAYPSPVTPAAPTTFQRVRRTGAFWHLINIHFLGCAGHSIILAHVVSIAIHSGVPGLTAAGVLSAVAGASILGRLGSPILAERLGGRRTFIMVLALQGLPILMLFGANLPWHFYLFALLFGPGYGGETPPFPMVNRQYYGSNSPLSNINGWQLAGAQIGMALGSWLGGALFDLTGTYTWTIAAATVFSLAGTLPSAALPSHRPGDAPITASAADGAGD